MTTDLDFGSGPQLTFLAQVPVLHPGLCTSGVCTLLQYVSSCWEPFRTYNAFYPESQRLNLPSRSPQASSLSSLGVHASLVHMVHSGSFFPPAGTQVLVAWSWTFLLTGLEHPAFFLTLIATWLSDSHWTFVTSPVHGVYSSPSERLVPQMCA